MRVIAGRLGGREFAAPKGHRTHPMSDKIRGALFNMLGDISGLTVLDAFAGSGALSIEAVSRGAKHAIAVERDKNAVETARGNVISLGVVGQVKVTQANISSWSDNNPERTFDLVLCDPPFDIDNVGLLNKLSRHVVESGTYVLSLPADRDAPELSGLLPAASKDYGDAQLVVYKHRGAK